MSRSGYTDDAENIAMWRGQVMSCIRGKPGQTFLRELLAALDALTAKRLIAHELAQDGEVCALGAVGVRRGMDLGKIDPDDYDAVADAFGLRHQLAREIEYENDEGGYSETPEERFTRVRAWVAKQIRVTPEEAGAVEIEA